MENSRIAKILVEEAGFVKGTTTFDVEYWAKQGYTSYFSKRVLKVIEKNAYRVAAHVNDYWDNIEMHNAEMLIARYI